MLPKSCLLAAVDLGSNSFRLEIDRYYKGRLLRKDYIREPVRLGRGLHEDLSLDHSAMERGWNCLKNFNDILHKQKVRYVRAVATQTLRQANNRMEFIEQGQELLGCPIEVISGQEEAHLIYLGVSAVLNEDKTPGDSLPPEKRFVVDVGGRSTEVIIGQDMQALAAQSCPVGSVGLSMDYFADNQLTPPQFSQAVAHAHTYFEQAAQQMQHDSNAPLLWEQAYGASGTIGAISSVLKNNQISDGQITRPGLDWIYEQLIRAGSIDALQMTGLGDRKDVIGGGLSVMLALFDTFPNLRTLVPARGALRQGVLYKMIENP